MAARSPARFLAPIALVAFAFALYTVVQDARDTGGSPASGTPAQTITPSKAAKKAAAKKRARHRRKTYRVRAGDTPSSIALKFGVTVQQLERLNPNMDPQALTVGERIRLRK